MSAREKEAKKGAREKGNKKGSTRKKRDQKGSCLKNITTNNTKKVGTKKGAGPKRDRPRYMISDAPTCYYQPTAVKRQPSHGQDFAAGKEGDNKVAGRKSPLIGVVAEKS